MDKEILEKINQFTRREFTEEELYIFPVKLCGNEIDRDGECFSDNALEKMKELFIGTTVICDHNPSTDNQTARIFDTEVIADAGAVTKYGQPYKYLKGMAYMVRTDKNKDIITEIDAGIKKEVSVGCSDSKRICSVCGSEVGAKGCLHQKGKIYDGKLCYHIIDNITDAYELSFVAVPAQADAGITKKYETKGGNDMENTYTQEQLNEAVKAAEMKYAGWISPEDHQKAIDTLSAEKKSSELALLRLKTASETGLPSELADRLTGSSEEELKKDAEKLASLIKPAHQTRSRSTESGSGLSGVEAAFYAKNPELRKEN